MMNRGAERLTNLPPAHYDRRRPKDERGVIRHLAPRRSD
jgi:hypothetical protein